MTEPTAPTDAAPRPSIDRSTLIAGGLILIAVAGLAAVSMADRAALRRATGDARALTESLLDHSSNLAHGAVTFVGPAANLAANRASGVPPAAPARNGHVAGPVPVGNVNQPPAPAPTPAGARESGGAGDDAPDGPPADA